MVSDGAFSNNLNIEDLSELFGTITQLEGCGDELASAGFADAASEAHDMARKIRQFQAYMDPRFMAMRHVFEVMNKISAGKRNRDDLVAEIEKYRSK